MKIQFTFSLILFICIFQFCFAQTGIGIFAGPQLTFFQPKNTVGYDSHYYEFVNPQVDIHGGIFGTIALKNSWYLGLDIGSNSKTYAFENYRIPFQGVSFDEIYSERITDWEFKLEVSKHFSYHQWKLDPFLSILYTLNSYDAFGITQNASISENKDSFDYTPAGSFHGNYSYNSFGLGGGIVIGNESIFKQKLKRFRLKISYSTEFAILPQDYYSIQSNQGSNQFNQTVKWQGQFSYINFDLMFYIIKFKTD